MPTYVTLDTIKEVMQEKKCISWKVMDEEENQLHNFSPPPTTIWHDSFNTLEKFLNGISGTNYVIIRVYGPDYVKGKGGDTATTIFTYYYRLRSLNQNTGNKDQAPGTDNNYLSLLEKMNEMKLEFLQAEHKREIKRLEEKISEQKNDDKNYFEKVAKVIGRELGKEFLKSEGINVDDEGNEIIKSISDKPQEEKKQTTTQAPGTAQKVDQVFKRTGEATVRIMKVSKALGSDYNAVAESFEDIATLAETNPLKLKEIFDKLKEK